MPSAPAKNSKGHVRWLRPDFQAPHASGQQTELDTDADASNDAAAPRPTRRSANPGQRTAATSRRRRSTAGTRQRPDDAGANHRLLHR